MSSRNAGKKPSTFRRAEVQAKAEENKTCSFCGFVLKVYPSLNGMTESDHVVFREHLKRAHGLKEDIRQ